MPISHFSTNLEESLSWFRKQDHHHREMDTKFHHHHQNDAVSEEFNERYNNYHHHNTDPTMSNSQQHYNLYSNQPTATAVTHQNHINNSKEAMFEKPLTPSDVGKLNRLVIPKQHAEKYFPLNGSNTPNNYITTTSNNDDSSPPSSGTLLSFEDESGKSWRFRYSYWNSSQSYVLTKGWSRYVKEKRLEAGDVVLFERDLSCAERLFIGWRRRGGVVGGCRVAATTTAAVMQDRSRSAAHVMRGGGYVGQDSRIYSEQHGGVEFGGVAHPVYRSDHCFFPTAAEQTAAAAMQTHKETPTTNYNNPNRRQLRLFGVNLDCQPENDYSSQTTSSENSSTLSLSSHHNQQGPISSSSSVYGGNYFDYAAGSSSNNNNVGGYHHNHYHHNQMGV